MHAYVHVYAIHVPEAGKPNEFLFCVCVGVGGRGEEGVEPSMGVCAGGEEPSEAGRSERERKRRPGRREPVCARTIFSHACTCFVRHFCVCM